MAHVVLALVGAILAASLPIGLGYWVLVGQRLYRSRKLRDRLLTLGNPTTPDDAADILRGVEEPKGLFDRLIAGRSIGVVIDEEIRRSGVDWTVGEFGRFSSLGAAIGLALIVWVPWSVALVLMLLGALAPLFYLQRKRHVRERQIEQQIPEAVDMLVRSMRAGLSLQAGMSFIGMELAAPVGPEFARFHDEQRLGIDVKEALAGLQERLGTLDARMLVLAILIQRETGGNLGEILGNLASVIRERIRFRDHVAVLTAESTTSAWVLSVMPVVLFGFVTFTNPDYTRELTGSGTGRWLLAYAVTSLVAGIALLRRMARVEA